MFKNRTCGLRKGASNKFQTTAWQEERTRTQNRVSQHGSFLVRFLLPLRAGCCPPRTPGDSANLCVRSAGLASGRRGAREPVQPLFPTGFVAAPETTPETGRIFLTLPRSMIIVDTCRIGAGPAPASRCASADRARERAGTTGMRTAPRRSAFLSSSGGSSRRLRVVQDVFQEKHLCRSIVAGEPSLKQRPFRPVPGCRPLGSV
jgi:hypothetical protein